VRERNGVVRRACRGVCRRAETVSNLFVPHRAACTPVCGVLPQRRAPSQGESGAPDVRRPSPTDRRAPAGGARGMPEVARARDSVPLQTRSVCYCDRRADGCLPRQQGSNRCRGWLGGRCLGCRGAPIERCPLDRDRPEPVRRKWLRSSRRGASLRRGCFAWFRRRRLARAACAAGGRWSRLCGLARPRRGRNPRPNG
jgi:hypothetical protein